MPAASAVAGFSPIARRLRPALVRFKKNDVRSAIAIARYARKPNDRKVSPNMPSFEANGSDAL